MFSTGVACLADCVMESLCADYCTLLVSKLGVYLFLLFFENSRKHGGSRHKQTSSVNVKLKFTESTVSVETLGHGSSGTGDSY
jgi:hypothetical protein